MYSRFDHVIHGRRKYTNFLASGRGMSVDQKSVSSKDTPIEWKRMEAFALGPTGTSRANAVGKNN